jgi:hypothetical protein
MTARIYSPALHQLLLQATKQTDSIPGNQTPSLCWQTHNHMVLYTSRSAPRLPALQLSDPSHEPVFSRNSFASLTLVAR